ncbi:MAG TPA: calcium-binding protein [Falsiroseomonas sp.]|jgi:hypothetical protein|nr:calcium-binding protein [Falsiroseomonas sp.]
MAISFINSTVTTTQDVAQSNHLILGEDANLVVDGGDAVRLQGDKSRVTVQGLVASSEEAISTEVGNGGTGSFNNLTVEISAQGMVTGNDGIYLNGDGNGVVNDGTITAGSVGALLSGERSIIANHGHIEGWVAAVSAYGGSDIQVFNTGTITGLQGSAVSLSDTDGFLLRNEGTIQHGHSVLTGAAVEAVDATGRIENTGTIGSGDYGVHARLYDSGSAMLELFNSGVISGGEASVKIEDGITASLVNAGSLVGDASFGSGHDLYDGSEGKLFGALSLGAGDDTAWGGAAVDSIAGGDGDDLIEGNGGADVLRGDAGDDTLHSGEGNDLIWDGDGADKVDAGAGDDEVISGNGADVLEGGLGRDTLSYSYSAGGVTVNLATGRGRDGDAQGDRFSCFENLWGSTHADRLAGDAADNQIAGLGGNDTIDGGGGKDEILGGDGDDIIEGGLGRDILFGEAGFDTFVFRDLLDSPSGPSRDQIRDFVQGEDLIDLSLIDANANLAGEQAFTFRGTLGFTGAGGEVRYVQAGSNTLVYADVDGDKAADFGLLLNGLHALTVDDFLL